MGKYRSHLYATHIRCGIKMWWLGVRIALTWRHMDHVFTVDLDLQFQASWANAGGKCGEKFFWGKMGLLWAILAQIWQLLLIFRWYVCRGRRTTTFKHLHNRGCTISLLAIWGEIRDFTCQTASRSVQPFCHNTSSWPTTDRLTDRPWTHG